MRAPSLVSMSQRVYGRLLILFPTDFRAAYAAPMVQLFTDCCRAAQRERGTAGVLALWMATLGDLVTSAAAERLTGLAHHYGGKMALKRLLDVVFSGLALLLLSPLLLVIALAVRLDSRGPVLYRSPRIGRFGRPFTLYKFRSMPMQPSAAGPRYTRVGRWLRQRGLDELPQLVNVLKGDMSLIGPRPALASEVDAADAAWQSVLTLRPGVSGPAPLAGVGPGSDVQKALAINADYVRRRSIGLDLRLLAQTARRVLRPGSSGQSF